MTSSLCTRSDPSSAAAALLAASGVAAVIRGEVSDHDFRIAWVDIVCKAPLAASRQKAAVDEIAAAARILRVGGSLASPGADEAAIGREQVGGVIEIAWSFAPHALLACASPPEGGSRFVALWQECADPMSLAGHKDLLRVAVCYEVGILRRGRAAGAFAFAAKVATETLNRLAIPLFVLGSDREIVRMNSAARTWLRSDGRLCLANKRLIGGSAVLNEQLRTAITRATSGPSPELAIVPLVDISDNRPSITLSCTAMSEPRGHVLMAIQERRCDVNLAQQTLTALGLTQAERRLASSMATGMSLQKAASASGITFSTARSYLKRIFGKLGIARQSDLVGLVAALTPVFLTHDFCPTGTSVAVPELSDSADSQESTHGARDVAPFRRARQDTRITFSDSILSDPARETASEPYG